jgi:hypothetical protein
MRTAPASLALASLLLLAPSAALGLPKAEKPQEKRPCHGQPDFRREIQKMAHFQIAA